MFRFVVACVCALFLGLDPAGAQQKSASSVFAENRMAVVHVQVDADPAAPNKQPSYGTGFIIGSDGYVLTAKHVLNSYVSAAVTPVSVRIGSLDGQQVAADYLPFDIGVDVAMLKLRNPIGVGLTAYRTVLRGDSTKSGNGNTVYIVGFNLTSNISIAQGLIASNLGGGVGGNLQWDIQGAGIVFGMSGAPVFNDNGEVIGLITGGQPGTGIEFAYPEQLLENFAVIPGWKRAQPASTPPPSSSASGGQPLGSGPGSGDAIVMDGNVNYNQSGFSFARNQAVAWNSPDVTVHTPLPSGCQLRGDAGQR